MKIARTSDDGKWGDEGQRELGLDGTSSESSLSVNYPAQPGLDRCDALKRIPKRYRPVCDAAMKSWEKCGDRFADTAFFALWVIKNGGALKPAPTETVHRLVRLFDDGLSFGNDSGDFLCKCAFLAHPQLRSRIEVRREDFFSESRDTNAAFRAGWRPAQQKGGDSWG